MDSVTQSNLESLLDTNRPFDEFKVRLLEQLVNQMLSGKPEEREISHQVLSQLKGNPESWRVVGTILELSKDSNTRFFALSILENCIISRWNVLPQEQKAGVKQYVTDMTISVCTDPSLANAKFFITKVNETLIQIVKHEWPHNWPSFIADLCAAARTNQAICENSMKILSLLSEEVFDFGRDYMTSHKVQVLMASLNDQFQQIYDLCMFVISNSVSSNASVSPSLLTATLQCLAHFVKWIPYIYLFQTKLIDILLQYFWDPTQYRVDCIKCLTEIASLKEIPAEGRVKLKNAFWIPITQKLSQLTTTTMEYDTKYHANSRVFWETFYCQLAICLTTFLKNHRVDICEASDLNSPAASGSPGGGGAAAAAIAAAAEVNQNRERTLFALGFLVKMTSMINHEETFKILVDFWNNLAENLLIEVKDSHRAAQAFNGTSPLILEPSCRLSDAMVSPSAAAAAASSAPLENPEIYSERLQRYRPKLDELRKALILKMAKPQEVCIHYDEESGTVDRDYETDTDEVALYNSMRETLVYLTNLGGEDTQTVMMGLLKAFTEDARNPHQKNWNPTVLSRLCWAIGSISGSMAPDRERSFLVYIIRELLWLCEHKRGKENKAIVASMIMYTFGQYPRFLKSYMRFLDTVISKVFEFMKESFQGVQDMACETFLKITQKCAKQIAEAGCDPAKANRPLIDAILPQLPELYSALETPKQQLMLYEGVGHIVAGTSTMEQRQKYINELVKPFNNQWNSLILEFNTAAAAGIAGVAGVAATPNSSVEAFRHSEALYQPSIARKLTEILRVNERIASATGPAFSSQLMLIYRDMLRVYNSYSSRISLEASKHGALIMTHANIKALRSVKRASLLLVKTFVQTASTATTADLAITASGSVPRSGSPSAASVVSAAGGPGPANGCAFQFPSATYPVGTAAPAPAAVTPSDIIQYVMLPLLEPVLQDYKSNVPQARDYEVLSLLTTLITNLGLHILSELPKIFEFVFDSTLDMIKADFHSFPDHRTEFYKILKACSDYCFEGLFSLPELQRRYFVESLLWALKHEQPAIAEQGLTVTQGLLKRVCSTSQEILVTFCRSFYWNILAEIFGVLTDTLHKSGFQHQALVLMYLIQLVELGRVNDAESGITKTDVMMRIADLLVANFSNLNRKQVEAFVVGLFNKSGTPKHFSLHLRDFLVQLKEFSGADELFEVERKQAIEEAQELERRRRMQIPGMVPQYTAAEITKIEDLE